MKKQNYIETQIPLLDEKGEIINPGYSVRSGNYLYNRAEIKSNPLRIKEWDFYQISNDKYMLQVVYSDISFGGGVTFSFVDFETGKRTNLSALDLMTMGSLKLPFDAEMPHKIKYSKHSMELNIDVTKSKRHIIMKKDDILDLNLTLEVMPELESMIMAVPFKEKGCFYYNQKMNSMPVSGYCIIKGKKYVFTPDKTFCVLDWGRGVWPFKANWYWGNGTTRLDNEDLFGFEIGYGFGNMEAASENMLFYNGKADKIGEIKVVHDDDWMKPWHFIDEDGRFDMTMTPIHDNYTNMRVGPVGNVCHQVFGNWKGKAVLGNGKGIDINNMTAFCEFSDNRW